MSTATYAVRRNQNLYRPKAGLHLGPVSISFLTIAAIVVLALLYITQITKTNVFGYRLSQLQAQRDKILADKQGLEVEAARLQSIQRIESSPAVQKLVPQTTPTYATR